MAAPIDKYSVSILAIKAWQDIWAKTFNEAPMRVTMEYLIHSELDWMNQDFKSLIDKQCINVKWVAQEEIWKQVINATETENSRLWPFLSSHKR